MGLERFIRVIVVLALVCCGGAVVGAPEEGQATQAAEQGQVAEAALMAAPEQRMAPVAGDIQAARARLEAELVQRGEAEPDARVLVAGLSDEDVRVLAENPRMLSRGGEATAEQKWGIAALIGVGLGIAAAFTLATILAM
ncbi:MAG: hypothetical protein JSU68_13930 [Phycisphaerales bacterium]|nr:MAG: hypothetical protein JSU68_13930 [Phycisphaerales bacterium]